MYHALRQRLLWTVSFSRFPTVKSDHGAPCVGLTSFWLRQSIYDPVFEQLYKGAFPKVFGLLGMVGRAGYGGNDHSQRHRKDDLTGRSG